MKEKAKLAPDRLAKRQKKRKKKKKKRDRFRRPTKREGFALVTH